MNCKDAQQLIELLVHDSSEDAREIKTPSQWTELDAHLAACPQCRSEAEELRRVRSLLSSVSTDRPTDKETASMWSAIQSPVSVREVFASVKSNGWWVRNRSLVATLTGAAAVLILAFLVGNMSLDRARMPAKKYASNVKGLGYSAKNYFEKTESNWGTPVHSTVGRSSTAASSKTDGAEFGLGVDARFPRSADMTQSQFAPAPPTEADKLKSLQTLGYTTGPAVDSESVPSPPARAGSKPGRRSRGGTGNTETTGAGFSLIAPTIARDAAASGAKDEPQKAAKFAYDSTEGVYHIEDSADEAEAHWDLDRLTLPGEFNDVAGAKIYGFNPSRSDEDAQEGSAASTTRPQKTPQQNLKIIKTGELGIEVEVYGDAVARVDRIVEQFGGFVADASTREEAGGTLVGRIVIRTVPERFEEIFAALKAVGRVESENVKAADVTAEYVDTEARIHSLKITEERLRELIANKSFVDKIASLLEVERELNRVRTEIEKFEGQLRLMADRVALSTIVLTIREPGRTVPSASLSVEVATLEESTQKLADLLARTSGRLVSGKTTKRGDGTLLGEFQLETSLAHFAGVVAGIEALGRVQQRQVTDQQFGKSDEPWAQHVKCAIALALYERTRQLPSGGVKLEVNELEEAMKRLGQILQTNEATIASNQASRLSNGTETADIQIRVPAGRFADLVESLTTLGRTISKTVSGETDRIVGGAAAVPCNLTLTLAEEPREVPQGSMSVEVNTFETARQTLSRAIAEHEVQVLDSASNQRPDGTWQGSFRLGVPAREMEAFVRQVESLGRVAARQISGLGLGDLSRIDPNALGVIELTMSEKSTLAPATSQTTASIRARIREGLEGFYSSMGLIAYGLVVLLPLLVLALLLGWIVTRLHKRRKNRSAVTTPAP